MYFLIGRNMGMANFSVLILKNRSQEKKHILIFEEFEKEYLFLKLFIYEL